MGKGKQEGVPEDPRSDPPKLNLRTGGSLQPYDEAPGCGWWIGLLVWVLVVGGVLGFVLRGAVKSLGWKGVW